MNNAMIHVPYILIIITLLNIPQILSNNRSKLFIFNYV